MPNPEKPWRLYVNGQLGLPFETRADALKAAKGFEDEGFDCVVVRVTGEEDDPIQDNIRGA